jgi:hypothetical protein
MKTTYERRLQALEQVETQPERPRILINYINPDQSLDNLCGPDERCAA